MKRQACDGYHGVQINPKVWMTDLEFADDIVVLADDLVTLQFIIDRIVQFASAIGLEIIASKTKIFSASSANLDQTLITSGLTNDSVSSFKYLGSTILPNGQTKAEIKHRIDSARTAFLQLMNLLWRRSEMSLWTKLRVFSATVRPVFLYGCETGPLRVEDVQKMGVFDH